MGTKFTGESCKCTPRQSKSPFLGKWGDLGGGRGYLGSYSVYFESDDKKGRQLFRERKVHPLDKILVTPMTQIVQNRQSFRFEASVRSLSPIARLKEGASSQC